jgi:hypothetical protein
VCSFPRSSSVPSAASYAWESLSCELCESSLCCERHQGSGGWAMYNVAGIPHLEVLFMRHGRQCRPQPNQRLGLYMSSCYLCASSTAMWCGAVVESGGGTRSCKSLHCKTPCAQVCTTHMSVLASCTSLREQGTNPSSSHLTHHPSHAASQRTQNVRRNQTHNHPEKPSMYAQSNTGGMSSPDRLTPFTHTVPSLQNQILARML